MKTKNLLRMIALVAVFAMATNFAYSTGDAMAQAKQDLQKSIKQVFKGDISRTGNYLYENNVYKLDETAKLTLKVNEDLSLEVLKVECSNCDASEYVKYVFASNNVKADELLAGKAFTINIRLKYKAK
ncbi:MAG: hypothetical protein JXR31_10340 [Prolixibacteraceae bacterium]|nr:hypothetical protein [Prolixibacteraceae bacterium]MBN2774637.1 hypothetical protein [Prolixibacteraceae bacterium]